MIGRVSEAQHHRDVREMVSEADRLRDARDWVRAAAAYRQAVAVRPGAAHLHVQLGHALKESGDVAGAEAAYHTALRLAPKDADIPLQLGHLFNLKGDLEAACIWYEAAAQLAPQDADIAQHLAETQKRQRGQPGEQEVAEGLRAMQAQQFPAAATLFREAVEQHGRAEISALLGHALKENGDYAGAHTAYRSYLDYARTQDPSLLADAELQLGHLCKIQMHMHDALEHYVTAKQVMVDPSRAPHMLHDIRNEIHFCMNILFPTLKTQ